MSFRPLTPEEDMMFAMGRRSAQREARMVHLNMTEQLQTIRQSAVELRRSLEGGPRHFDHAPVRNACHLIEMLAGCVEEIIAKSAA